MCLISIKVVFLLGMTMQCLGKNSYDMRIESITPIEGEEETLTDYKGLKLIGRERATNGSIFYAIDLTDDLEFTFQLYTLVNGNWSPLPYGVNQLTSCEYFQNYFFKYIDLANINTNFPTNPEDYCPLTKGEYWFKEVQFNTDTWVSFMKRGLTKLRVETLKNGKGIGGFEGVANIVDRIF